MDGFIFRIPARENCSYSFATNSDNVLDATLFIDKNPIEKVTPLEKNSIGMRDLPFIGGKPFHQTVAFRSSVEVVFRTSDNNPPSLILACEQSPEDSEFTDDVIVYGDPRKLVYSNGICFLK